MMALAPAFHMSRELPATRQLLPILKVIYRNATRIQESGGRSHQVLHPEVAADHASPGQAGGEVLREAVRLKDMAAADQTFAALAQIWR